MREIGTDENFGDKTGGDRPREHCISISLLLHDICFSGIEIVCTLVI